MKKIDLLSKGYGINPKIIWLEPSLSIYAKATLSYLLSYTGAGRIECWPKQTLIAEHIGASERTVRDALAELVNIGWIEIDKLYPDSTSNSKKYKLTIIESLDASNDCQPAPPAGQPAPPAGSNRHGKSVSSITHEHKHDEHVEHHTIPHSEKFAEVWLAYVDHRKEMKKPLKTTGIKTALSQLAQMPESEAIDRLNRAITNGWQGFIFPNEKKKKTMIDIHNETMAVLNNRQNIKNPMEPKQWTRKQLPQQ